MTKNASPSSLTLPFGFGLNKCYSIFTNSYTSIDNTIPSSSPIQFANHSHANHQPEANEIEYNAISSLILFSALYAALTLFVIIFFSNALIFKHLLLDMVLIVGCSTLTPRTVYFKTY